MAEQNIDSKECKKAPVGFKRSVVITIIMIVAAIVIFSAQTFAYFVESISAKATNIKAATFDVKIVELGENDSNLGAFINPSTIVPGSVVHQAFKIENKGQTPLYTRVKVEKVIIGSADAMPDGWEELISCNFMLDDESTPDILEGLWVYRDGYYYYLSEVEAGSSTSMLFNEIIFSEQMGNEFASKQIQLKVTCQAVQTSGNSESSLTAWGWPAENVSETEPTATPDSGN